MRRQIPLIWVICCTWTGIQAEFQPPSIYIQPPHRVIFYIPGQSVEMPCVAEGVPTPRYTWKKNGYEFDPSAHDGRMNKMENIGTFIIIRPQPVDDGYYQCFAENMHGRSASVKVQLREAKLGDFGIQSDRSYYPQLGGSLTLSCVPPESVPQAEVYWVLRNASGQLSDIDLSARVTTDLESRLHFTNTQALDSQGGKGYVCVARNSILNRKTQGFQHFVNPRGFSEQQYPVSLLWISPSHSLGIRGEQYKIKCIFAGNPTPDVQWSRADGTPLPGHVTETSGGQELVFDKLEFTDAGDYRCSAQNSGSTLPMIRPVSVSVEARPYWREEPKDVEVLAGKTATFRCDGGGVPQPNVQWFINAVPLGEVIDSRLEHRFVRVNNMELVFNDVTVDDAMVIQCNVTNKHGYIWADVYLNVYGTDTYPVAAAAGSLQHGVPVVLCVVFAILKLMKLDV